MYSLIKPLLFSLPPETAHCLAAEALTLQLKARGLSPPIRRNARKVMGLDFANPLGLAAGFDKNGEHIDALGNLGFGFIEAGGVTAMPQPGGARPRLFRLPRAEALINRMGFNNVGAARAAENLSRRRYAGVVGINLGKNAGAENAAENYAECLQTLYPYGDFFTINISSPNTPGLRDLQRDENLRGLLAAVAKARDALAEQHKRRAPLAVKIAPDLSDEELRAAAAAIAAADYDAVIACNTTTARPSAVRALRHGGERGGLSGRPLAARATAVVRLMRDALPARVAVIGVGGVFSARDAEEKLAAGADLVQIYTGLIYRGPALPAQIINGMREDA